MIPAFFVHFAFASGDATFTYNGEIARIGDHRLEVLSGLLLWEIVAFAIAYGFWKRKRWSRHIIPAVHVVALVVSVVIDRVPELLFVVLYVALVLWYFYGKDSVNEYYRVP